MTSPRFALMKSKFSHPFKKSTKTVRNSFPKAN